MELLGKDVREITKATLHFFTREPRVFVTLSSVPGLERDTCREIRRLLEAAAAGKA